MEDLIKQYVMNGGELFSVTQIDTIHDSGTKVIITTDKKIYLDKSDYTYHSGWPTTIENVITDIAAVAYITERIESYVHQSEILLSHNKALLQTIKSKQ